MDKLQENALSKKDAWVARQRREVDIRAQTMLYDAGETAEVHVSWSAVRVMFIGLRSSLAGQVTEEMKSSWSFIPSNTYQEQFVFPLFFKSPTDFMPDIH